jgi:hypothetical protein
MRLLLALALFVALACGGPPAGKTIYRGGSVITLDAQGRVVEALGVEGDRIRAVGSEAEVRRWAGDGARVVELDGRALLPFEGDLKGSLEPGKLADLVILGRSPLVEPAESLAAVPVLETIVGGESVWRAP